MIKALWKKLLCPRGIHAKEVEARYRLVLVNKVRRVLSGQIECRTVCRCCGHVMVDWIAFDPIDLTDQVSLPESDWARLQTSGEAVYPIGDLP